MRLDAAPYGPCRGDTHRLGRNRPPGEVEPFQVPHPSRFVLEALLGQLGDHRAGQLAHVGQSLGVDHVVAVARPQDLQEVQPALGRGRGEGGEVIVADLRADAVAVPVTGASVVDADPRCRAQPSPQYVTRLFKKVVLALVQQADDLPLGDLEPKAPQLCHQTWHGDLTLVVLEQHEPVQFRPEVADNTGRHRCDYGPAIWGEPALAADADHVSAQHEILDEKVFVALEAGAGRYLGLDEAFLMDSEPLGLAAPNAALLTLVSRVGLGALLHAAGFDRRPCTPFSLATSARSSAIACFSVAFSANSRSLSASRSSRDSAERGIFVRTSMRATQIGSMPARHNPLSSPVCPGSCPSYGGRLEKLLHQALNHLLGQVTGGQLLRCTGRLPTEHSPILTTPDVAWGFHVFPKPLPVGKYRLRWKADVDHIDVSPGRIRQEVTYHLTVKARHY